MINKIFYGIGILFLSTTLFSFVQNKITPTKKAIKTIILDAGHGGHDSGAEGWNGSYEKDICLAIALKTEKAIKELMPDVKVLQTRKTDEFVDLRLRADFANENNGDIFVAIHCNSVDGYKMVREVVDSTEKTKIVKNAFGGKDTIKEMVAVYKNVKYPKDAQGMETYVWNMGHNDIKKKALKKGIADIENAQILLDTNYKEKYGGGSDINSAEFVAKASLKVKKYFLRSQKLGELVQIEGTNAGRNNRKVKQRGVGIWVLQATNMPSVLVETGYISHPDEEAYLVSKEGQLTMAKIIAKALKTYKMDIENPTPMEDGGKNNQTGFLENSMFINEEEIV
jgi:N-acetylmuramoyl-L-alanine amidase